MSVTSLRLPPAATVIARIAVCREELAALKKLLRAVKAAEAAEVARKGRARQSGEVARA